MLILIDLTEPGKSPRTSSMAGWTMPPTPWHARQGRQGDSRDWPEPSQAGHSTNLGSVDIWEKITHQAGVT